MVDMGVIFLQKRKNTTRLLMPPYNMSDRQMEYENLFSSTYLTGSLLLYTLRIYLKIFGNLYRSSIYRRRQAIFEPVYSKIITPKISKVIVIFAGTLFIAQGGIFVIASIIGILTIFFLS